MSKKKHEQTSENKLSEQETAAMEEETVTEEPSQEQVTEEAAATESAEEPVPEQVPKSDFDALNDKYLRLMAEYENFRRRTQKEKDAIYPEAAADAVKKFLPVLDSFHRALDTPCADEAFKKGVDMIFQSFGEALSLLGVEEFGVIGEPFDPTFHNGVARVENPDFGENEVADVYQKGYKIGDKILRTAMVVVAN